MFEYQRTWEFFGQIAGGMEGMGEAELHSLGAEDIRQAYRGLYFRAGMETLYRVNLQTRLLSRVLAPLSTFDAPDGDSLREGSAGIAWERLFSPSDTFAVFANCSNSAIRHSQFAAQCVKDGIVDRFRSRLGKRPGVERRRPDVWISLFIDNDRAIVNLELSGGPLNRRGYRKESVEAPMQETLAAAIIDLSEWDGEKPLYDPMCGSGTLLAEAHMRYARIPGAYLRRRFGFERMPEFDAAAWQEIKSGLESTIRSLPAGLIAGSDVSRESVRAATRNLRLLPGGRDIRVRQCDFNSLESLHDTVIVCNPPYGLRLGEHETVEPLYKAFGDFLKQRCTGAVAYVYFGERALIPAIGLRPAWKKALVNGALDGRLCRFDLYD